MSSSIPRKSSPGGGSALSEVETAVSAAVSSASNKQTITPTQGTEPLTLPLKSGAEEMHGSSVMPYSALEQLKEKLKAKKILTDSGGHKEESRSSEVQVRRQSSVTQASVESPLPSEPGNINTAKLTVKKQSRKQINPVESSSHAAIQWSHPVAGGDSSSLKSAARKVTIRPTVESSITSSAPTKPAKIKSLLYQRPEPGSVKKPVSETPNFGIKPLSELRSISANSNNSHEPSTQIDDAPSTSPKTEATEATSGSSPAAAAQLSATKKRKLEGDPSSQLAINKQNSKRPRSSGSKLANTASSSTEQDDVSLLKQKLMLQVSPKKEAEPGETVSKNSTDHSLAPSETIGIDKNTFDRGYASNSSHSTNNHDTKLLELKQPSSSSGLVTTTISSSQQLLPLVNDSPQPSVSPQTTRPQNMSQNTDTVTSQPIKPPPATESMPNKKTSKRGISPISYSQKPTPVSIADKPPSVSTTIKQNSNPEEEHHVGGSNTTKLAPIRQTISPSSQPSISNDSNTNEIGPLSSNSPIPPIPLHMHRPPVSEQTLQSQNSQVQSSSTTSSVPETLAEDHSKPEENTSLSLPTSSSTATYVSNDIPVVNPLSFLESLPSSNIGVTQAMLEEILKIDAEIARLHKQVRILELELDVNFET